MLDKEFRRLSRADLVDIIYELQKNEVVLKDQLKAAKMQLADTRKLLDRKKESDNNGAAITEATQNLTRIVEETGGYMDQIRSVYASTNDDCKKMTDNARAEADRILEDAQKEAAEIMNKSRETAERIVNKTNADAEAYVQQVQSECEALQANTKAQCDQMKAKADAEIQRNWAEFKRRVMVIMNENPSLSAYMKGSKNYEEY